MKHILSHIILLSVLLTSVSCDKWLEGTSSSQVSHEKMFSTRSGFHEALSGVYISMASADCYGRNFTFYANELSALRYNIVESSLFKIWQQHSYDDVMAAAYIESMWQSAYFTIANANKVLKELDSHRTDVMADEWEYNMVRGEMLAVRAFVHFDLLRMFGLSEWTGDNAGKRTVPYVTEYSLESPAQRSYEDTKALLLKDVEEALKCLESDPVRGIYPEDFQTYYNADGFWSNRTYHLNYYAVEALAARISLWAADLDAACSYASDVIENALDRLETVKWIDADVEVKKTDNDSKDWSFSSEHLFSLDVNDLYSLTTGYCFGGNDVNMALSTDVVETELFPRDVTGGSNDGAEDIRGYAMHLKFGGQGYQSYKLYSSSSMSPQYRNRLPMIRISEMYYILAYKSVLDNDAQSFSNRLLAVMSHRGYTDANFDLTMTQEQMKKEFVLEITREFIGEGQLLYWYKLYRRLNPEYFVSIMNVPAGLMYPYPTAETSYGHIQEK